MDVRQFQAELDALLQQAGVETAVVPGEEVQIGDTLRALLPVTETGDHALLEVMAAPCTEEMLLLQLYSTLILEIGPGYDDLKESLLDWNLTCPIGAFGIFRQGRQFYHKYTYPIPMDVDPAELAREVFYILNLVAAAIAERFPEAVRLSGHS